MGPDIKTAGVVGLGMPREKRGSAVSLPPAVCVPVEDRNPYEFPFASGVRATPPCSFSHSARTKHKDERRFK